MIGQFTKGKVAVFIDASNILYAQKSLGWRIDYIKLKKYFEKEMSLVHMAFYTGKIGSDEKQQSFLKKISDQGIKIVSKEVKFIREADGRTITKGNLDVELALDCFVEKENFETLVLFSGDSDFAYLLDVLKKDKKSVIVVSTRNHIARELIERAKFIALNKLRTFIEYR